MQNTILEQRPETVIESKRVFNTDINTLFRAWTTPEYLQAWWGPRGFTNTFNEYDLTPGGWWRFIMHGPEKGNYVNECQFLIIDEPHLLIWNHISPPEFQIVVNFTEAGTDKTAISFKMVFETPEASNKLRKFVPEKMRKILTALLQCLNKLITNNQYNYGSKSLFKF